MEDKKTKKNRGLGRGLNALFDGPDFNDTIVKDGSDKVENSDGVTIIKLRDIEPNKNQPRKTFDAEKLDALLIKCALPCSTDIDMAILYKNSLGDKKRSSDGIDIIICSDIGESSVVKMTLKEYADFLGIN